MVGKFKSKASRQKYWLVLSILGITSLLLLAWAMRGYDEQTINQGYARPFASKIKERAEEDQDSDEPPSREVRGRGLRESDIRKIHGRNYSTY